MIQKKGKGKEEHRKQNKTCNMQITKNQKREGKKKKEKNKILTDYLKTRVVE